MTPIVKAFQEALDSDRKLTQHSKEPSFWVGATDAAEEGEW